MLISIISLDHNNKSKVSPDRSYFPHFTEGDINAKRVEMNLLLTPCMVALVSGLHPLHNTMQPPR